jgi:hypothetical protein
MNIRSQRRTRRARRTRRTRRTRKTRRTKRAGRTKRTKRAGRTRKTKRTKRSRKTRRSRRVIYQSAGAETQNLEDDDDDDVFFDAPETPGEIAQAEEIERERLKADQVARAREQLAAMEAWEVEQGQRYKKSALLLSALQIWRERAQGARYDGERTYDEIIAHQKEKQAKFRSDGGMTTAGLTHRNRRQGI